MSADIIEQAIEKINQERDEIKSLSRKGEAVKQSVVETLITFCRQNAEFAQAIVQSGKNVGECIEYTVKGSGSSISDIEVYRKAVEFYFAGATVRFEMVLDIGDGGFSNITNEAVSTAATTAKKPIRFSLDDLL